MDINLVKSIIPKLTFKFPYSAEDFYERLYLENYHCHKDFSNTSTPDCAESIENYAERIKEFSTQCLYSGEHGSQGNQFLVYNVAEKNNLKYRHSAEVYWVKDRLKEYPEYNKETGEVKKDKDGNIRTIKDRANCHMMLIAKNKMGMEDMNYAISFANIDGYYYKPRIDLDLLFQIPKDNIIVTSACFTDDMMVEVEDGYKHINEISIEQKVLTHMGTWEKVSSLVEKQYDDDLFYINMEGCLCEIKCTKEHQFPTIQKTHNDVTKKIIWKRADELTKEDRVLSVIDKRESNLKYLDFTDKINQLRNSNSKHRKHIKNTKIEITNEFLELLGIYTAEGSLDSISHNYIAFTLNKADNLIINKVLDYSRNIFGIEPYIHDKSKGNAVSIQINSTEIYLIFNELFKQGAINKEIPLFIQTMSPEKQMQYIKGLFNGDGHLCKKDPKVTYCTISKKLALEVINILERNEIKIAAHCSKEYIDLNNIHHNMAYIIDINNKVFRQYWDTFRTLNNDYCFDWSVKVKWQSKKITIIDGVRYHHKKINYIKKEKYNGKVYCINVDKNHSFKLENISVHNCIAGWKYEDSEEIWLKIYDYFGDNFFLEVQYHNTPEQKALNKKIIGISKKHNIQIICGLDSHYITDKNSIKRDQILKYKGINYPEEGGWYLDYPDTKTVIQRFQEQGILNEEEIMTAIMNTNVFVNECSDIIRDRKFKIPTIYPDKSYKEKCKIYHNILNQSYKKETNKSKEKVEGIRYEANQITESGVVDYFLTSQAIIRKAIDNFDGILTTTSRGSMASFVTNKLLGLTTIDRFNSEIPIYPERFLTKERVLAGQMPD